MLPVIDDNRGWKKAEYYKTRVWYYGNIQSSSIKKLCKNTKKLDFSNLNKLKEEAAKFSGRFAFIIRINKNLNIAFVDRIKSIPIFVAKNSYSYQLSNCAVLLKQKLKIKKRCEKSFLSIKMAGYCIGRQTLYKNLFQLLPGEVCIIKKNKVNYFNYYSFINKKRYFVGSKNFLSKKLSELTLSILDDLLQKNSGKIVVPLSAGYDSRLIISALYHLNAKNIICYSYGKKNNFEAKTAKRIANKFNYPWYFVELSNKIQRKNFSSSLYKEYTNFSDSLASWSYVQDFFAVNSLIKRKIINKDNIILNGNTGDFISGGHLPALKLNSNIKKYNLKNILSYIIKKHFSLWENYFDDKQNNIITKMLLDTLPQELKNLRTDEEYKIYEYIEFVNRQSNYVIQGQRVYDFYNIKWDLPLWHDEYLNFWNRVPYNLKVDQTLYKFMLFKNNWGNVWKNIPINKYSISPISIRYIRNFLKIFFLFKNKNDWEMFDKKYLAYFTELVPHYSYFNYFDIIKNKKIARNAVAWHVDHYLKLKI
mgnify:CR=1 FL=1